MQKLFASSSAEMSSDEINALIGKWIVLLSPDRDEFRTFGTLGKIREIIKDPNTNQILLYNIHGTRCGPIRRGEQWQVIESLQDLDLIAQ